MGARVVADLAHQVSSVTVSGWDETQGQRVSATSSGTSFATPLTSGTAAWVWTVRPSLHVTQLFDLMGELKLYGMKAALPHLRRQAEGSIINVASIFEPSGRNARPHTCSSKVLNGVHFPSGVVRVVQQDAIDRRIIAEARKRKLAVALARFFCSFVLISQSMRDFLTELGSAAVKMADTHIFFLDVARNRTCRS